MSIIRAKMDNKKKTIGERLEEEISRKFGTLKKAAEAIGSRSSSYFRPYITGVSRPGMLLRKKLADIGLDVEYIMGGEKLEYTEETLEMNAAVRRKLADMKYRIEELEKELRDIPGLESPPKKKKNK